MELEDHWEILSGLSNEWHQGEGSEVTLRVTSAWNLFNSSLENIGLAHINYD